jgi:indole-3-glycerol phosphate synthase
MHNILLEIVERKKEDLKIQKKNVGVTLAVTLRKDNRKGRPYRNFRETIISSKNIAIIAEVKIASPNAGVLGSKKDILERVMQYEKAGANAISFITEQHYFHGDISFIPKIKEKVAIPVLQKDFVIDAYQIYEAKQAGSDALLLIARLLNKKTLQKFVNLCQDLDIEPVVEINNAEDLEKAIATTTNIISVNARNLEDFSIDVAGACNLLKKIPDKFIKLGFSGIHGPKEVQQYKDAGVKGVLVGTELMKARRIKEFIRSLYS